MRKKVLNFIVKQKEDIRKGGIAALLHKIGLFLRKAGDGLLSVLLIPAVLIIRVIRPLRLVRFGHMRSERIGHFAINTEAYLCKWDSGQYRKETFDIFYYDGPVCNQQLKRMWDRILRTWLLARWMNKANLLVPGWQKHTIHLGGHREADHLLIKVPPHIYFTDEEEDKGKKALGKMGIGDKEAFVCFAARDSAYLATIYPEGDWDYHNYRDVSVQNYIPAAEELAGRGYFSLRMGAKVTESPDVKNPKIIDYALNGRDEFMDIYLGAKCRFFLSSSIGIAAVPILFRRPVAWTNFIPLGYVWTWSPDELFIPKKLWLKQQKRFLTFSEILSSDIRHSLKNEDYEQAGIEPVENTPDEIRALAIEMDDRLSGRWQATKEDEELQRRFWRLFRPRYKNQIFESRIGTEFLRENEELLR